MRRIDFFAMLCTASIVLFATETSAQCSARDVLQNRFTLKKTSSAITSPTVITSAVDIPAWKTITVGTMADTYALRNALDAAGCGIEDLAEEILVRPAFALNRTTTDVHLVVVSVAELGIPTEWTLLVDIYARAERLGL